MGLENRITRRSGGSPGAGMDIEARAQIAALNVSQTVQDALIAAMATQAQVAAIQVQIAANVDNPLVDAVGQPDGSLLLTWEDGATSTVPAPPSVQLATDAEFGAGSATTAASPSQVHDFAKVATIASGGALVAGRSVYVPGANPSVDTGGVPAEAGVQYGVMVDPGATLTVPGIGTIDNAGTSKAQFLFRSTGTAGAVEQIGSDAATLPVASAAILRAATEGDPHSIPPNQFPPAVIALALDQRTPMEWQRWYPDYKRDHRVYWRDVWYEGQNPSGIPASTQPDTDDGTNWLPVAEGGAAEYTFSDSAHVVSGVTQGASGDGYTVTGQIVLGAGNKHDVSVYMTQDLAVGSEGSAVGTGGGVLTIKDSAGNTVATRDFGSFRAARSAGYRAGDIHAVQRNLVINGPGGTYDVVFVVESPKNFGGHREPNSTTLAFDVRSWEPGSVAVAP